MRKSEGKVKIGNRRSGNGPSRQASIFRDRRVLIKLWVRRGLQQKRIALYLMGLFWALAFWAIDQQTVFLWRN